MKNTATSQEKSTAEEFFGEVISSYTRAQAIEDGVLVDLTTLFPGNTRIYKWPVACTSAVWGLIEKAPGDPAAWVSDLCWMSTKMIVKHISESEHLFQCIIGLKTHTLKVHCGPGDNAEPVITIMLPNED